MENKDNPKVGDLIFLFYEKSGIIAPARILEKTIKENIDEGLKVEYFLEVFIEEEGTLTVRNGKFSDNRTKMFSSIKDLREALENHIKEQVNAMIDECSSTYELAKNEIGRERDEKSITS